MAKTASYKLSYDYLIHTSIDIENIYLFFKRKKRRKKVKEDGQPYYTYNSQLGSLEQTAHHCQVPELKIGGEREKKINTYRPFKNFKSKAKLKITHKSQTENEVGNSAENAQC